MSLFKEAILIRSVEERLLELFSQNKIFGTLHTSVGQEFSAVAFAGQLDKDDHIFSNHRCHGHYISFTKDIKGLMAELMGLEDGTCGGVGGSQHLCKDNFYSNGIQGGMVSVATGLALSCKLKKSNQISTLFIGDGTLGEGVVYEALNIASKWELPLLIVCENNHYAQSTSIESTLAGDILDRAKAFGMEARRGSTFEYMELISSAKDAIEFVRTHSKPLFFLVETYRLNPHSKGDELRSKNEIESFRQKDPIEIFRKENSELYNEIKKSVDAEIDGVLCELEGSKALDLKEYISTQDMSANSQFIDMQESDKRVVELINEFFIEAMEDSGVLFIGEDVLSPYGGAFKVAKGLSELYPKQVLTTPISEAAITGIANGLALNGFKPFVEIMFGDFVTLALDQIINHAAKFHQMYNKQVSCGMVLRTPMGGGRGYGPTHSQSLERFLVGIDGITTIALNSFVNPKEICREILKETHPVVVIENKLDYARRCEKKLSNFNYRLLQKPYPTLHISPKDAKANVSVVLFGGMARLLESMAVDIFKTMEIKIEIICPSKIYPLDALDLEFIRDRVAHTKKLITVEEGNGFGGFGSEVVSQLLDSYGFAFRYKKVSKLPYAIPVQRGLEERVLPNREMIFSALKELFSE